MKLLEIQLLLELREILQRHGVYGYWIDPQNNIHPVKYMNHYGWLEDNILPKEFDDSHDFEQRSGTSLYSYAFDSGFVRIEHQLPEDFGIQGTPSAIKRAASIIKPTISQPDVEWVNIDIIDENSGNISSHHFQIPKDRAKAMEFIEGN